MSLVAVMGERKPLWRFHLALVGSWASDLPGCADGAFLLPKTFLFFLIASEESAAFLFLAPKFQCVGILPGHARGWRLLYTPVQKTMAGWPSSISPHKMAGFCLFPTSLQTFRELSGLTGVFCFSRNRN